MRTVAFAPVAAGMMAGFLYVGAAAGWLGHEGNVLRRETGATERRGSATDLTPNWPPLSRDLARRMAEEYGKPDETAPEMIVWRERGAWDTIVVFRDMDTVGRPNLLRQAVSYSVPVNEWRRLSAFHRGATYDPVLRQLAARSESEATNILALNLADEVIRGTRSPAEAEKFYDLTVALAAAGKSSRYMRELLFVKFPP